MRKISVPRIGEVYCPLLIHDEEFCLLDNCRYYDSENQECIYAGTSSIKKASETEANPYGIPQNPVLVRKAEQTVVTDEKEKSPAKEDISYGMNEEKVVTEGYETNVVSFDEQEEQVPSPRTEPENELCAKQIWDLLRDYNESEGIQDYDELVGSLIKVVNSTEGIHYLTPKSAGFWYSRVSGLVRYNRMFKGI